MGVRNGIAHHSPGSVSKAIWIFASCVRPTSVIASITNPSGSNGLVEWIGNAHYASMRPNPMGFMHYQHIVSALISRFQVADLRLTLGFSRKSGWENTGWKLRNRIHCLVFAKTNTWSLNIIGKLSQSQIIKCILYRRLVNEVSPPPASIMFSV